MTVIAFDGKTMAADRQGEYYATKANRKKISRIDAMLVGGAGETRATLAIIEWLKAGGIVSDFPKLNTDDRPSVLAARRGEILLYDNGPYPTRLANEFFAIGSGCDAAMAAMFLGFDAVRAVEVACEICTGCGGGIDSMILGAA